MVEAIVEFDYKAQHDDELTISVGDIISNIRKDEGGWWEGELAGKRGLFPDNFVRELKKETKKEALQCTQSSSGVKKAELSNGSSSPGSEPGLRPNKQGDTIRKRRCKVAFSYLPQNEDELELKVGDVIEIINEVEEGWWEGSLNGKTGMFPSNFTRELLCDSEELPTPQEESRSSRTSVKDSTGSESDGGDSSSTRSDEIQPKKVRGIGFGDIFKDRPIKLRPRSMDLESEVDKKPVKKATGPPNTQETMKTELEGKNKVKEYCKVLFPYEAQNEDELSIKEGDIVTILSKECADAGWWFGELSGRKGVFPDNFVKLFVPEVEKERPKKPPPPAAPAAKPSSEKRVEVKKVPPERPDCLPQRKEDKEELKLNDVPKPPLPTIPPKKPLPPKTTDSLGRPSLLPAKRPERPERPAAPSNQSESPRTEGGFTAERLSSDRPSDIDVEDFDSVVSSTERLNHPTASRPRLTDRRPRSQVFTSVSLSNPDVQESTSPDYDSDEREKEEQDSSCAKAPDINKKLSKTSPVLPVTDKPAGPPKPWSPTPSSESLSLEDLRAQLKDLRAAVEVMKTQHRREIKQLSNELDEEKKIRLSLQMEVEHIKNVLSK